MTDSYRTPGEAPRQPLFTSRRRRRRLLRSRRAKIIGLVVFAAVAGGGGWLWHRSRTHPAPPEAGVAAGDTASPASPRTTAGAPLDLPSLDASDAFVRKLVSELSSRPELASWLVSDKLVHRFVVSVVDVADGKSPEDQLGFLTPRQPFQPRKSADGLVMDPASYRRYDALTATLVSLDDAGVARLYKELSPLTEEAYQDLGLHGGTFESVLARAFGRLLAVSFPNEPPALLHNSVPYSFESPALEDLSPAAKHLLRFGPTNGREVQAKLRELADAMGIVPQPPAGG
jgi:hypothetical protein